MTEKLVLFDIDRTLLQGGSKTHGNAFSYAFMQVYRTDASIDEVDHSGKTDTRIIFEVLGKYLPREEIISHLPEAYEAMRKYFRENISSQNQKIGIGIKELLNELKKRSHILGLVTGNLEEIARLKLKKASLLKFFDFEVSGFGEISETRDDLAKEAIKKAQEKYGKINNRDIFVVGDSPHDIECGKANKVKTIAVATGNESKSELERLKPDYLFDDFENFHEVVDCIEK